MSDAEAGTGEPAPESSASTTLNGSEKHAISPANSPGTKKIRLSSEVDNDSMTEIEKGTSKAEIAGESSDIEEKQDVVREADVGIVAYVDESLVPVQGGIIKQRFSDFHVREVSTDGVVSHITSMYPPSREQGGSGLFEYMMQQEAEQNDPSGDLARQRREKENEQRSIKEAALEEERNRSFDWTISEADSTRLATLLGDDTLTQIKKIWLEGPTGWKKESGDADEAADPSSAAHEQVSSSSRGRGRGGKAGRGGRQNGSGRSAQDPRSILSQNLTSKEDRTAAHQLIRELFEGNLTTDTVGSTEEGGDDAAAKISQIRIRWKSSDPSRMRSDRRGEQREDEAPSYIHFLMQKANRESQDALNIVARSLNLLRPGTGNKAMRELSVAGTKDKRAVTVQKVAFRRGRKDIDEVWKLLNGVGKAPDAGYRGGGRGGRGGHRGGGRVKSALDAVRSRGDRGIRVGHLQYAQEPLHLGLLKGNAFVIVLREVHIESREQIDQAVNVLRNQGFVNYYGMQRFGTSVISTHTVGIALLQDDFEKAISLIMATRPGDADEVQEAREAYARGDHTKCLKLLPHHHIPERAILQRMLADKQSQRDWKGYFMAIPRALRTMYVHAYQSYIWNRMVSERIRRFGCKVPVIGDLVLLSGDDEEAEHVAAETEEEPEEEVDAKPTLAKRVSILKTDADVNKHSIHDVVIPLPGKDIQYAKDGWMSELYKEMLAADGLTPDMMGSSKTSEFALTGDYRKMLHVPQNVDYKLMRYRDTNANLCQSDEDRLLGLDAPNAKEFVVGEELKLEEGKSMALILSLTLGVSAYATMALREILKQDTSVAHQKDLTERSDRRKGDQHRDAPYRNEAVNKIQGKQIRTWGAPKPEA